MEGLRIPIVEENKELERFLKVIVQQQEAQQQLLATVLEKLTEVVDKNAEALKDIDSPDVEAPIREIINAFKLSLSQVRQSSELSPLLMRELVNKLNSMRTDGIESNLDTMNKQMKEKMDKKLKMRMEVNRDSRGNITEIIGEEI